MTVNKFAEAVNSLEVMFECLDKGRKPIAYKTKRKLA